MCDFDEKHVDLRDRYPEVERPFRLDGSKESVRECMKPVMENLEEIIYTVNRVLEYKRLEVLDMFVFQSRAMGTCKPNSDIDIYIQLHERFRSLVEGQGVFYKNTGAKLICDKPRLFNNVPSVLMDNLSRLRVDLFLGMEPIPPAKDEYKGRNYYIRLEDLRGF